MLPHGLGLPWEAGPVIAKLLMALTMALTAIGTPGTTADVFQAGESYIMIDGDGHLSMWSESNGSPGLQAEPVFILGQMVVVPDTRVIL